MFTDSRWHFRVLLLISLLSAAFAQNIFAQSRGGGGGRNGYFELFANGSWYQYNNGIVGGDPSVSTTTNWGTGMAYRFLSNTSIELSYQSSYVKDKFTQDYPELAQKIKVLKKTTIEVVSLNLILEFADRKSSFRPYIKGGGGYMTRQTRVAATAVDKLTGTETDLTFPDSPKNESVSAQGGLGIKMYVSSSIALELSGMVYATDLDEDVIYTHYQASGGLRYLF